MKIHLATYKYAYKYSGVIKAINDILQGKSERRPNYEKLETGI